MSSLPLPPHEPVAPTDEPAVPAARSRWTPPSRDPLARLWHSVTLRRLALLLVFAAGILVFRRLLLLLVFFVLFERPMGLAARWLSRRMPYRLAVGAVSLAVLGALGGAIALGTGRALRTFTSLRMTLPDRIAAFRDTPLFAQLQDQLQGTGHLVEGAQRYAATALGYLGAVGHALVYVLVGFILAVVFLLERDELRPFLRGHAGDTVIGTLLRWLGYLADAVSVTLQFQIIVAAINAVLTYPVMLLAHIPHATSFVFMVFFSGMVPVVGNFVAGAILTLLAYQADGWWGVVVFVGLTFVLHKLESYYLNPRLAARHIRLPGFVLVVSLILWEQLVGFVGLFVSFPFLYVAMRIRDDFRRDDEHERAAVGE